MAASLFFRINSAIQRLEQAIYVAFSRRFPPASNLALVGVDVSDRNRAPSFTLKDLIGDGFLFAVPKHRRTIEKRWKRKYGMPGYSLKIMLPKQNLRVCNTCGDDHEAGTLCPTCYKKVMDETKAMQDVIQEKLGLEPIEKEVVVLYNGEKDEKTEFFEGKRIVEMEKERPSWFSKNLLQKTTQPPANTKDVKPTSLG